MKDGSVRIVRNACAWLYAEPLNIGTVSVLSPSGKFQDLRASLCILELSKQPDVANTHAATPSPAASHCTARRASPAGTAEIAPRPCALVSLCQPTRAGRPAVVQRRLRWRRANKHEVSAGRHLPERRVWHDEHTLSTRSVQAHASA